MKNEENMAKFRRQFDSKYKGTTQKESSTMPSKTVPDQNISVKELLLRHTRNAPLEVRKRSGVYTEDTLIPRFQDNLIDRRQYIQDLIDRKDELQQRIKEEKDEAARAAAESMEKPNNSPGTTGDKTNTGGTNNTTDTETKKA